MKALLAAIASVLLTMTAMPSAALCAFNADGVGSPAGVGTSDGLLFMRFSVGLAGTSLSQGTAVQSTVPDLLGHIQRNGPSLDMDGDQFVTDVDTTVIARYLFGFRGEALIAGLTIAADAPRRTGAAIQSFIDGGCLVLTPDPRINVWNAMNAQLAQGTSAGIEAAKQYMTPTAVENYGTALLLIAQSLPSLIASYSPLNAFTVGENYADYLVAVPVPGSLSGEREVHVITFLRMDDGTWRVDTM